MAQVKLSFRFVVVLYVFTSAQICYTDDNPNPREKAEMKPDYYPNGLNVDDIKVTSKMNASKHVPSSSTITQLWHSKGKCPKGTIPIRRTKEEDVLRAKSVERYGKKKRFSVAQQNLIDAEFELKEIDEYASAYVDGREFYGTRATFNVWNPKVQESNELSLAQIWIVGCNSDDDNTLEDINTIEAGWHVHPELYGNTATRLFIFWTSDGFQETGCYNLQCSGFVQTSNKIALGSSLSPISQLHGTQYQITLLIWKDRKGTGDWWMRYGDTELVGYWPSSMFSHLRESALLIEWGGEVVNTVSHGHHTTTQMGSGQFPGKWFREASYVKNIETVDESNTLRTTNLNIASDGNCYDVLTATDDTWGRYLFYGGPGRNANCP
ncbi:hypothetical protein L1987_79427 [Smallanthus sonchifolius]|uniref:Uncharacterized protein n=1 Tax=Smallanthus sonchifolius TaxID=185202 RepID=A0ACB8ZFP3_9ASTR|nr:hypothetical protein L1987_79427 [Smallanthus sonchifolius]